MVADWSWPDVQGPTAAEGPLVTLLDTNALVWLTQRHRRTTPLARGIGTLAVSPATLLELQFLLEAGRLRLRGGSLETIAQNDRWAVDEPPPRHGSSRRGP